MYHTDVSVLCRNMLTVRMRIRKYAAPIHRNRRVSHAISVVLSENGPIVAKPDCTISCV